MFVQRKPEAPPDEEPLEKKARAGEYKEWDVVANNRKAEDFYELMKHHVGQKIKYTAFQDEVGEEKKTPHVQACVVLSARQTMSALQKWFKGHDWKVSMRPRYAKSNLDKLVSYCTDPAKLAPGGKMFEMGKKPKANGKQTKPDEIAEDVKAGMQEKELFQKYGSTYVRTYKGWGHAISLMKQGPERKGEDVKIVILYGGTHAGKSTEAMRILDEEVGVGKWKKIPAQKGWFNGYNGEAGLLINEMSGDSYDLQTLMDILDKWPTIAMVKGAHVDMRATCVVFTSRSHPRTWFKDEGGQLVARVKRGGGFIRHMQTRDEWKGISWEDVEKA